MLKYTKMDKCFIILSTLKSKPRNNKKDKIKLYSRQLIILLNGGNAVNKVKISYLWGLNIFIMSYCL